MTGARAIAPRTEARALELWEARHRLTDAQRREVGRLPEPLPSIFAANDARRLGARNEALSLLAEALPLTANPSVWRSHVLRLQGTVYADLHLLEQAVASNTLAQDAARRTGDDIALACCLQDLSVYPHQPRGRVERLLREARELAEKHDADDLLATIDFNVAYWRLSEGAPPEEVLRLFGDVEERARTTWPDLAAEARAYRVTILASSGDHEQARVLADELPDEANSPDEETRTQVARARAWVLAEEGRVDEATDTLTRWLDAVSEDRRLELLSTLTEVLAHAGRYAQAWRASQDLVRLTRTNADSLGVAQARALEIWYDTRLAQEARVRERARADELQRALEQLRAAHEQIRELSRIDLLTGVHNRRYMHEVGTAAMEQASPETPVWVALVDIDGFKLINDTYGHLAGDAVLRRIAEIARELLDPQDILARYGGEEFVIIRPAGTAPERNLRDDLRAVNDAFSTTAFTDDTGVGPSFVTASAGLYRAEGGTLEEALHIADLRMYRAKRLGGDTLVDSDE